MMDCLRTEELCRTYADRGVPVRALDRVSMRVARGEFVALVGPSGSGKTTLLNLMSGLDAPTSGRVFVDGEDLTALGERQRADLRLARIGLVFQDFNLLPVLSALENVEYVMLLQGRPVAERRARAQAMLAAVGLAGLADRRPHELSGGQQQRVALARAIVTDPAIVLADEPTANLDTETGTELLDMMHDLNAQQGITFLLCTHDPLVMERADRIVRMRDGRLEDRP